METLTHQQLIQNIIQDYADKHPQEDTIETQVIFDQKNHHYLLLYVGWLEEKHIVISNKNETVLFLIKARNPFCHRLTKN